jgi:hypothetical protein
VLGSLDDFANGVMQPGDGTRGGTVPETTAPRTFAVAVARAACGATLLQSRQAFDRGPSRPPSTPCQGDTGSSRLPHRRDRVPQAVRLDVGPPQSACLLSCAGRPAASASDGFELVTAALQAALVLC